MKRTVIYSCILAVLGFCCFAAPARGDTLKLKSGQSVEGKYLGGTDARIDFLVAGRVQGYKVSDVQSLTFSGQPYSSTTSSSPATPPPMDAPAPSASNSAPAPAATSSSPDSITIPAGTTLVVRMVDGIDSSINRVGDTFHATLEAPLAVGDTVLAPKYADVYGRLVEARQAGRVQGQSELRLELTGVTIQNQVVPIVTGAYSVAGSSRGKNTAEKVGGGAVIGALIGAIAGGGKGAAIGAGVGAGAGTAAQVMTHGQEVRVPSETVLNFTLAQPVTVPAA